MHGRKEREKEAPKERRWVFPWDLGCCYRLFGLPFTERGEEGVFAISFSAGGRWGMRNEEANWNSWKEATVG